MNKPRFKPGDKVYRPEYWGNCKLTVKEIHYLPDPRLPNKQIDECSYYYTFEEETFNVIYGDGAWDYQCIVAEVYESPLYKALKEE